MRSISPAFALAPTPAALLAQPSPASTTPGIGGPEQ
jgi:hypothetical protein